MTPLSVIGPTVRIATPADLGLILHLQRRETEALGFLPYDALADRLQRRQVVVGLENDEPAAFCVFGAGAAVTIHQAACMVDARRRQLGLAMADAVRRLAGLRGGSLCRLSCATDLTGSLAFWEAAGFERRAVLEPAGARRRGLVVFEAPALEPVQPALLRLPTIARRVHRASSVRRFNAAARAVVGPAVPADLSLFSS